MVRASIKASSSIEEKEDIEPINKTDLKNYYRLKPVKYNSKYRKNEYNTKYKLKEYAKHIKDRKIQALETRFRIKTGIRDLSNPTKEKIELMENMYSKFNSDREEDVDFVVLNWSRLSDYDLSTFDSIKKGKPTKKDRYANYIKRYEQVRSKILLEKEVPELIKEYGLIAEEITLYFPELVFENADGKINGIKYTRLHALHIAAIQDLNKKIDKIVEHLKIKI